MGNRPQLHSGSITVPWKHIHSYYIIIYGKLMMIYSLCKDGQWAVVVSPFVLLSKTWAVSAPRWLHCEQQSGKVAEESCTISVSGVEEKL